jgi:uncharacterized SAM-binding protein YcdF (DUF218 family)
MLFLASKLFWIVAQPGNFLLLLLCLGVLWLVTSARRRGLGLAAAVTLALVVITVAPVGEWVIAPLEARFPPPQLPKNVTGIILLGGAVDPGITERHHQVALNDAAERITATLALARRYPKARVLISGGHGEMVPVHLSEGEATRSLLVADGLDPDRIMLEDRSRNTIENAVFSKELAKPGPDEVWLLVTSAAHMPRAVGCFRHVGWAVLPYPVDYHTGQPITPDLFELGGKLALLDHGMREWVGLLAYRLLGRIDTLFPGPAGA